MTSSIFLPRMSRAWPEPSTHLMESTMFVFPEPLGPTMAVTPPSNWISVCRAKVLKPSNCRDLRNKLAGSLLDRFPELPAPRRGRHRFFGHRVEGHHLGGDRLDRRGFRRRRLGRRRLALLARRAARAGFGRLRRGRLGQRTEQALEGGSRRVLLRFLLAGSMARAERLRTGEHDRRVLAVLADTRTFAVVHGRLTEALLRDLLEPALEVLVADGRWEGAVAVEVVVVGGVVAGVEKHRAEHCLERVGEQRLEVAAAALRDALPEIEIVAEAELLGELGERVGVDHRGARLGQLALGRTRVVLVEILRRDQLEDGVAEIFEALVVTGRDRGALVGEGAVGDGFEQEPGVTEVNPDLLLELLQ